MEMDKEDQAPDIQVKLEAWKLKNGRLPKTDKPCVPRFKKQLPVEPNSENNEESGDQPRVLQQRNSQNLKSIMKSEATKNVSNVKSKIDTNLNVVRREQLEEWKLKRKQLETESKENKDKERRWTMSGRRESILPMTNMTKLPFVTSCVADRSFVKPKSNIVNASLCIPPKHSSENNLTIKKATAPIAKVNAPKTQFSGKETRPKILNTVLKNTNLPKSETAIKEAPVKALNPASQNVRKVASNTLKTPILPKSQVAKKVNPAKVVNNDLKNQILPKLQVVKKVESAKVANNDLKHQILPNSQVVRKADSTEVALKTAKSVSNEVSVKATVKNLTTPRVSISSLHRKPTWKNGSKVVIKPSTTTNKKAVSLESINPPASDLNVTTPQVEKKPWNPGTSLNRSFSNEAVSGNSANVSFVPGGILKKSKGLVPKSPKMKRNVNFAISPGSPEDAPLNERLVSWLLDNNQSPCEFRHLQCFGAALENETLQVPIRSFDCIATEDNSNTVSESNSSTEFETATIHSFDSTATFVVDNPENMKVNDLAKIQKVVNELHALLLKSYPIVEASRWLDLIYENSPEVSKMAYYWLCRIRIAMSYGAGVEDVLQLVEQGIKQGAQPLKKLEDYKKKRIRPATPRPKKDEGKENIFGSTVVKFKIGEMETGSKKEIKREDTPMRLTPVRRSHRISNSVKSEFDSIAEIPLDLKARLVLTPNKFLDVDMEASNIDENVY